MTATEYKVFLPKETDTGKYFKQVNESFSANKSANS